MHVFLYKTCPKGTTKPKSSQAEAEAEANAEILLPLLRQLQ